MKKLFIFIFLGILIIINFLGFMKLSKTRNEFITYLDEKYSENSFKVGFIMIGSESLFSKVTCLDDSTDFTIHKNNYGNKIIDENYLESKNNNSFNSKINDIFKNEYNKNDIESVMGTGTVYDKNKLSYSSIRFYLIDDVEDPFITIKDIMGILKDNNIESKRITIHYEISNYNYELYFTSNNYDLTEREIINRLIKNKKFRLNS